MDRLPAELHCEISGYLSPRDIANLARASREMYSMYGLTDAYRGSLLTRSVIRIIQEDLPFLEQKNIPTHQTIVNPLLPLVNDQLEVSLQIQTDQMTPAWNDMDDNARARSMKRTALILGLGKKDLKGFLTLVETNMARWLTKKIFWELIYSLFIQKDEVFNTSTASAQRVSLTQAINFPHIIQLTQTATRTPREYFYRNVPPPWVLKLNKSSKDIKAKIFLKIVEQSGRLLFSSPEEKSDIYSHFLNLIDETTGDGTRRNKPSKQLLLLACRWLSVGMVEILLSAVDQTKHMGEQKEHKGGNEAREHKDDFKWNLRAAIDKVIEVQEKSEEATKSRNKILKALVEASGRKCRPRPTAWHAIWQRYFTGFETASHDSDMLMYKSITTLYDVGTPIERPQQIARLFRWVLDKMTHGSFDANGKYVNESYWVGKELLDLLLNKAHVDPNLPLQTIEVSIPGTLNTPTQHVTYTIRPLHYAMLKLNERWPGIEANLVTMQDYLLRNSQLAFAIFCLILCGADPFRSRVESDNRGGNYTKGRMADAYTPVEMAACLGTYAAKILQIMLGNGYDKNAVEHLIVENYKPRKVLLPDDLDNPKNLYTKVLEVNVGYNEITPTHHLKPKGYFLVNELMAPNFFSDCLDHRLPDIPAVVQPASGMQQAPQLPVDLKAALSALDLVLPTSISGQPVALAATAIGTLSLNTPQPNDAADGAQEHNEEYDDDEAGYEAAHLNPHSAATEPTTVIPAIPPLNTLNPFAPVASLTHDFNSINNVIADINFDALFFDNNNTSGETWPGHVQNAAQEPLLDPLFEQQMDWFGGDGN